MFYDGVCIILSYISKQKGETMATRKVHGKFAYQVYEFFESEKAPGYVYADQFFPPQLISWFAQSPFAIDLNRDGYQEVIVPMNRGYATGLDTRTPFLAFSGGPQGLSFSPSLQETMPITNGARRASPVFFEALKKETYVTVAHDTGDGKGAELLVIAEGGHSLSIETLIPALPGSVSGVSNYVNAHSLASGDLTGNGLDDILVGHWGMEGPYALLQNQDGRFVLDEQPVFKRWAHDWPLTNPNVEHLNLLLDLHIADFTGNGLGDIVAGWGHGSTHSYLFPNRDGLFSFEDKVQLPPSIYGIDNQLHLKTLSHDFNGDGHEDMVILWSRLEPWYGGHYIQYLQNDGAGRFIDKTEQAFIDPYRDAIGGFLQWSNAWQLMDVNGNGRMDIVGVSARNPGEGIIYLNAGNGKFLDYSVTTTGGRNASILWWGDFNNNGKLDYLTLESFWNDSSGSSSTNRFNVYEVDADLRLGDRIAFKDLVIAHDIEGNAGQAYRLYKAAFDRIADPQGLGFWIDVLDRGVGLAQVARGFVESDEFGSLYGTSVSNDLFVELLYQNVLGREPDASGYQYWLDQIATGLSREQVLVQFSESTENKNQVAGLIATGIEYSPFIG